MRMIRRFLQHGLRNREGAPICRPHPALWQARFQRMDARGRFRPGVDNGAPSGLTKTPAKKRREDEKRAGIPYLTRTGTTYGRMNVHRRNTQHILVGMLVFLVLSFTFQYALYAQSDPTTSPTTTPTSGSTIDVDDGLASAAFDEALDAQVESYLAQMSNADKVGQLFVITFEGDDVDAESDIAELISDYRIGGVVISPERGNFTNAKVAAAENASTPAEVAALTNRLQALSYGVELTAEEALDPSLVLQNQLNYTGTEGVADLRESTESTPLNLPLFIGVEQLGDNLPGTALRSGFSPIPSQMALGAAWNPELTQDVGEIIGRELSAVGVNMLLGPNLDVWDQPQADVVGSLGIYSFGGSPFWVGRQGQAYISGVHEGSDNRVITIARHFPGQGDSDRLPTEEVATIQSSEQELMRTDMPPFVDVTQNNSSVLSALGNPATTDGLMTSHMRYSGIQGNISDGGAPPLSLVNDLEQLLEGEQFGDWRGDGLVMTNSLGSQPIRRHYESLRGEFPPRQIALDAFNAGHDLLYLADFSSDVDGTWESEKQNIIETITFFQERYANDSDFAAQVNEAVRRILRVKLHMYLDYETIQAENGTLDPSTGISTAAITAPAVVTEAVGVTASVDVSGAEEGSATGSDAVDPLGTITDTIPLSLTQAIPLQQVLADESDLDVLAETADEAKAVIGQVARDSLTLLYPEPSNLATTMALPPQSDENILIITNSRLQRECADCIADAAIGVEAIESIINDLYGNEATGQISAAQITSKTFLELEPLLQQATDADAEGEATPESETETEADLPSAETPPEMERAQSAEDATSNAPADATPAATEADLDQIAQLEQQIADADWIIFAMLDVNTLVDPHSDVVKRFLAQRGDQLRNKDVVVLAFNAPYFLDATEVSRLSAYFGAYSKIEPFIESAVRGLFRASTPTGSAPVSVPGTRFKNLAERLAPDPNRTLPLAFLLNNEPLVLSAEDGVNGDSTTLEVGDTLTVQVGPVLDLNGHRVPDNTLIEIQLAYEDVAPAPPVATVPTRNGLAVHNIVLESAGELSISANSRAVGENEEVAHSETVAFTIRNGEEAAQTVDSSAEGQSAEAAVEAEPASEGDQTAEIPAADAEAQGVASPRINLWTLMVALITIVVMLSLLLILQVHIMERVHLVRNMLWAIIVGLFAYILYGVGMVPGAEWLQTEAYPWGTSVVVFIAMLFPLLWLQLRTQ